MLDTELRRECYSCGTALGDVHAVARSIGIGSITSLRKRCASRAMITVELTLEETQAVSDLISGNPIDTRWLCSANNKITAAIDGLTAKAAFRKEREDGSQRSHLDWSQR